jgi:hypothetical protein
VCRRLSRTVVKCAPAISAWMACVRRIQCGRSPQLLGHRRPQKRFSIAAGPDVHVQSLAATSGRSAIATKAVVHGHSDSVRHRALVRYRA